MAVRKPDLAGSWYPGSASDCIRAIEEFSRNGISCPDTGRRPIGGIVPHAGWYYSGKIASGVIRCLSKAPKAETVVVFGRHLHPSSRNYIMKEGSWSTPLGPLDIDLELAERLTAEFLFEVETASRYEPDNTIEIQLPFIKYFLPEVRILPIGVPPAPIALKIGERVGELAEELGKSLLVLGSTDLTHYGYNYGFTPRGIGEKALEWVKNSNDKMIIDRMLEMDAEKVIHESLKNHNACCAGAVAAAITASRRLGADHSDLLAYATSYDIRPDSNFVGYAGILYSSVE
ncbi:MAG: AmmeMemoRadiSam system protein B [Deltaproteobacteria bacterium]|nr:AmmeMemoRadiSam system protein B [Deltaproteobacteria bacterium]MBW2016070.1 AmmeMemoRadiSam system protein B [Deltaproteobacteria bacterium]MBW2130467.1 AmmeMemoRadiSam system protein B [Deltaproteobacteria bacterium]MBW2305097.1 AmmeMemoRadiSam system protein B [Deltaproteobacteria bacterium]